MIKGFKIANKNMPHKRFKNYKQKYTLRKI